MTPDIRQFSESRTIRELGVRLILLMVLIPMPLTILTAGLMCLVPALKSNEI